MYFIASLVAAVFITLFVVSKIAKMLHAKRPGMGWIFLASIAGSILAALVTVPVEMFVTGLEPIVMILLSVFVMLVASTAAFKYINEMNWGGAITTNIAHMVLGMITVVAAVVLNGESLEKTFETMSMTAEQNTEMFQSVATGDMSAMQIPELVEAEEVGEELEELEPVLTELDFLPPAAVLEKEAKAKRVYTEPKFQVVSIRNIRSAVGKSVRIKKRNGTDLEGYLVKLSGNDAVVKHRLGTKGTATIPVVIAEIKTLEVYK